MMNTNRFDQNYILSELGDLPARLYGCLAACRREGLRDQFHGCSSPFSPTGAGVGRLRAHRTSQMARNAGIPGLSDRLLEAGNMIARDDLERSGILSQFDPHLHGHHHALKLREGMLNALQQHNIGQLVEDTNYSLALRTGPFFLRMLKARIGCVPGPGHSHARLCFINQQAPCQLALPFADNPKLLLHPIFAARQHAVNLFLTWEVSPTLDITSVQLSCTKRGLLRNPHVELYWSIPVAHPATQIQPAAAGFQNLIELDEADELKEIQPIFRLDDEELT